MFTCKKICLNLHDKSNLFALKLQSLLKKYLDYFNYLISKFKCMLVDVENLSKNLSMNFRNYLECITYKGAALIKQVKAKTNIKIKFCNFIIKNILCVKQSLELEYL